MTVTPRHVEEYYVFLTAPDDMNPVRQEVREFFNNYNITIAAPRGLRFIVIDWENYSLAGVGRPRELLTSQTLEQYSDRLALVIGIIGQRFGSPASMHESGTEEECEWAMESRLQTGWPEIKWFFRKIERFEAPSEPEKILDALDQWKKVRAFRERLAKEKTFDCKDFLDIVDFRDVLRHDIASWLNGPERLWAKSSGSYGEAGSASKEVYEKENDTVFSHRSTLRIAIDEKLHQIGAKVERLKHLFPKVKIGTPIIFLWRATPLVLPWVIVGVLTTASAFYFLRLVFKEPSQPKAPLQFELPQKTEEKRARSKEAPILIPNETGSLAPPEVAKKEDKIDQARIQREGEKNEKESRQILEVREEMVSIPTGGFLMGCNETVDLDCGSDEKPGHLVFLDAYSIDKHEVTVADYRRCVKDGACSDTGMAGHSCNWNKLDSLNHPINCVDWSQALEYCSRIGKRLPTEAEWEKAARGTDGRIYPWGNNWDKSKVATHTGGTVIVGSYTDGDSPYGLHDMAGNVWEWVQDWYAENYYQQGPSIDPKGPEAGLVRVLRGGSWVNDTWDLRISYRGGGDPSYHRDGVGFRCAR